VKIHELAFSQYEKFHGALSAVVEDALREYLERHSGGEGGTLSPHMHTHTTHRVNRLFYKRGEDALSIFMRVLSEIKRLNNYPKDEVVCEIRERDLVLAINNVKGIDLRTVKKYIKAFEDHRLIKYDRGASPNMIFKVLIYPECGE